MGKSLASLASRDSSPNGEKSAEMRGRRYYRMGVTADLYASAFRPQQPVQGKLRCEKISHTHDKGWRRLFLQKIKLGADLAGRAESLAVICVAGYHAMN